MATSQRLLGFLIFALLVAGIAAAIVKGPADDDSLTVGPTPTTTPTSPEPTQTFTFPGPVPTMTDTDVLPTDTATPAGPEVSPGDELPRTGGGSLILASVLTLATAAAGGSLIRRTAGRIS